MARTRKLFLTLLVVATLPALPGCGVTAWQREQDASFLALAKAAHDHLNGYEMSAAIAAAKPGVPR